MTKLLTIDTSTYVLSVGLYENAQVLAEYVSTKKENHSVRLMPAVRSVMEDAGMSPAELDGIAVAAGPGSYTGVRIGVTTAKSMAWALEKPLYGVSSLEALAYNGLWSSARILSFFDARRGQAFAGIYESEDGFLHQAEADSMVMLEDLLTRLAEQDRPVLALSPDLDKHRELLQQKLGSLFIDAPGPLHTVRPAGVWAASRGKTAEDLHTFVPQYLRLAEAEANWQRKQNEHG
ncbi:tRNA (adenosine(37)-N6)-threonylcarbamoyltransferase complex dimerization subunit type 1 TsaB [Alkalicoccus luteus]|uniref:tRNA (adenosine(37)-N6)-threonylcarbamoyltransferase complex dimerization subunit type 1 TsaB n=1 Tax=Alkalicoccus luteus TaxID=1237094 RepID=UPI0040340564